MDSPSEARPSHLRDGDPTISAFGILNVVLRHRRILMVTSVLGVIAGVVAGFMQIPRYEAEVRFVTSLGSARPAGGVGGDLGPIQQRDPFDYYTSVLTSSDVRDAVLAHRLADGTTLQSRLRLGAVDAAAARRALAESGVILDRSTRAPGIFPVLTLTAGWTDPSVAADIANAFVTELANYDQKFRSAAARGRRQFIEKQVEDTALAMKQAEEALRLFREQNRLLMTGERSTATGGTIVVPPDLTLKATQLQREVDLQNELYLTLKRAVDQARIAELDEASGVVVIEQASPRLTPVGTGRRVAVMWGGIVGLTGGLWIVLILELRRRTDLSSPDAREFVGHLKDMGLGLTRLRHRAARALAPEPKPEQKS